MPGGLGGELNVPHEPLNGQEEDSVDEATITGPRASIYKLARQIKQRNNTLYNNLRSIYEDSVFVQEICQLWPTLPVVANLRCGLWYMPGFDDTCYFKSTDGHAGNWSFSLTRLNLHVALRAAREGGSILVDATRRGKRFPDSMSKTIPVWACVLNRAVTLVRHHQALPAKATTCPAGSDEAESNAWDCSLHLPLWVSATERRQIELRIDGWVQSLLAMAPGGVKTLAGILTKPLRPLWISQRSVIWLNAIPSVESWPFVPLVQVSASRPSSGAGGDGRGLGFAWNYVPGAGDDEESWARGLTPGEFWACSWEIIRTGPSDCDCQAAAIVARQRAMRTGNAQVGVSPQDDHSQQRRRQSTGRQNCVNGISGGGELEDKWDWLDPKKSDEEEGPGDLTFEREATPNTERQLGVLGTGGGLKGDIHVDEGELCPVGGGAEVLRLGERDASQSSRLLAAGVASPGWLFDQATPAMAGDTEYQILNKTDDDISLHVTADVIKPLRSQHLRLDLGKDANCPYETSPGLVSGTGCHENSQRTGIASQGRGDGGCAGCHLAGGGSRLPAVVGESILEAPNSSKQVAGQREGLKQTEGAAFSWIGDTGLALARVDCLLPFQSSKQLGHIYSNEGGGGGGQAGGQGKDFGVETANGTAERSEKTEGPVCMAGHKSSADVKPQIEASPGCPGRADGHSGSATPFGSWEEGIVAMVNCGALQYHRMRVDRMDSRYIYLPVVSAKLDRHSLEHNLADAVAFSRSHLAAGRGVLFVCNDGEDLSVCVCLAVLLSCFDSRGVCMAASCSFPPQPQQKMSKALVRQGLALLASFHSATRPSRGSLKQVFNWLTKSDASL